MASSRRAAARWPGLPGWWVLAAAGAVVLAGGCAARARVPGAGGWRRAAEVSVAALDTRQGAVTDAVFGPVSCPEAGYCTAGGSYVITGLHRQGFVISQVRGRWGRAVEVPGTAGLNRGWTEVTSVSCASPGNCAAGGWDPHGAFVASQVRGRWRRAVVVRPVAGLGERAMAAGVLVSCPSAGRCVAAGNYSAGPSSRRVFLASQVRGRWRAAQAVPGLGQLETRDDASVTSLSCPSAGNCSAAGSYYGSHGGLDGSEAFVVSQVHGTWGAARPVPGLAALNKDQDAVVTSLSCPSAGNCSAGGYYADSPDTVRAFATTQSRGRWGAAREIPGTAALSTSGHAEVRSVSCTSPGDCTAAGTYADSGSHDGGNSQAFTVSQVHGRWGTAREIPGLAALNTADYVQISSLACASATICAVAGTYATCLTKDQAGCFRGFIVTVARGTRTRARPIPGIAALSNRRIGMVSSISCIRAGPCTAVGTYLAGRADKIFATSTLTRAQPAPPGAEVSGRAESWRWSCVNRPGAWRVG